MKKGYIREDGPLLLFLIGLFIVIRVVNALHKDFTIVYLVCQGLFQQFTDSVAEIIKGITERGLLHNFKTFNIYLFFII